MSENSTINLGIPSVSEEHLDQLKGPAIDAAVQMLPQLVARLRAANYVVAETNSQIGAIQVLVNSFGSEKDQHRVRDILYPKDEAAAATGSASRVERLMEAALTNKSRVDALLAHEASEEEHSAKSSGARLQRGQVHAIVADILKKTSPQGQTLRNIIGIAELVHGLKLPYSSVHRALYQGLNEGKYRIDNGLWFIQPASGDAPS